MIGRCFDLNSEERAVQRGTSGTPDGVGEALPYGKRNIERDRIEKYKLYEQFGMTEDWIVHPYDEKPTCLLYRTVVISGLNDP